MTSADFESIETPLAGEIERGQTGIRILLTILFAIVSSLIDSVVWLVVIFSLAWTFITRRLPNRRLRVLANRIITYAYRIGRYVTYSESRIPFPFSDFPEPLEEPEQGGNEDGDVG